MKNVYYNLNSPHIRSTEANSATEKSAAAAEELSGQAAILKELTGKFKLR